MNPVIPQYDGELMDEKELNLIRAEPMWDGFVTQTNELIMLSEGQVLEKTKMPLPHLDDLCIDDKQ